MNTFLILIFLTKNNFETINEAFDQVTIVQAKQYVRLS